MSEGGKIHFGNFVKFLALLWPKEVLAMQKIVDHDSESWTLGRRRWVGPDSRTEQQPQPNAEPVHSVGEVRAKYYSAKLEIATSSEALPGFYDDAVLEQRRGDDVADVFGADQSLYPSETWAASSSEMWKLCSAYLEGLQWVMFYYYQGRERNFFPIFGN